MNTLSHYINQYTKLHANPKRFAGYSIKRHIEDIASLVAETEARTLLDYGCGKGYQYLAKRMHEKWGGVLPHCYDPGVLALNTKPEGKFDGVICTDVLEHVHENDIDKVLTEIFQYADKFVFLGICTVPSRKTLPNGDNCHITVAPEEWWNGAIGVVKSLPEFEDLVVGVSYFNG